jgi:molybdopterin-biosynthesis enzyme MoeA-like protein
MEASLTPLMEAIEAEFPGVKVFSLPSVETATQRRHIELGVKGEQSLLSPAFARLQAGLEQAGAEFVPAVNSPVAD